MNFDYFSVFKSRCKGCGVPAERTIVFSNPFHSLAKTFPRQAQAITLQTRYWECCAVTNTKISYPVPVNSNEACRKIRKIEIMRHRKLTLKVRILPYLTTFTQLTARLKNFLSCWLLILGLKEGLVERATVCIKSEVILRYLCTYM